MYHSAVVRAYDVLDATHVVATVTTYDDQGPDSQENSKVVVTSTVHSRGQQDPQLWLWEAIQCLQAVLDQA